jgi:N-acyl-D-aspartate/D-glutamate deacylase
MTQARSDIVIRGGQIVDGTGREPYCADIAINHGVIVEIGTVAAQGIEEIDANGKIVTPGWVDIHTHYDGQATWDQRMQPSSIQGTTTAVMGNCGVGFAPVRPTDRERLIRLMEGVEDIPGTALHAGLRWDWESFPEYLDALDRLPRDIDIAAQIPHSALRVYVMGERGADREPATSGEIERMGGLVRDAIDAGALGFSSSRVIFHRSIDGDLAPSVGAARGELIGIASKLKGADSGVLQIAANFYNNADEYDILLGMVRESGRPLSFSFVEMDGMPGFWDDVSRKLDEAALAGLPIIAQVQGRAVGLILSLQGSVHPFITRPSYKRIANLPFTDRLRIMRDPVFRTKLLSEEPEEGHPFIEQAKHAWDRMFELGNPPEYEPDPASSLAARAADMGLDVQEVVYDVLISGNGTGQLYFPMANFVGGSFNNLVPMLRHPRTVAGLSDGGAHVGVICDASVPTYMLSHWCRDRRGEKLTLADAVRRQTRDAAEAVGLYDRGVVGVGYRADINVIDFDRLQLRPPRMVFDLPAGERRLMQEAAGYMATIVAGQVIYREGIATGALPGRLVRGSQPAPD